MTYIPQHFFKKKNFSQVKKILQHYHEDKHDFKTWHLLFTSFIKNLDKVTNFDNSYYFLIQHTKKMIRKRVSVKYALGKLLGFVTVPQHIPCCSHFQLHIYYHFQCYSNLFAGSQVLLKNWDYKA